MFEEKKASHVLSSDNHGFMAYQFKWSYLWLTKYQALFVLGDVIFSGYVSHSNDSAVVILNSLFENMFLCMNFIVRGERAGCATFAVKWKVFELFCNW